MDRYIYVVSRIMYYDKIFDVNIHHNLLNFYYFYHFEKLYKWSFFYVH